MKRPEIIIGMTSILGRQECLREALNSLLPYVYHIFVYLQYEDLPGWATEYEQAGVTFRPRIGDEPDLGDSRKYHFYEGWAGRDVYFFTADDDAIYPPDYAKTMVAAIERYGRQAVVGLHGWDAKPGQLSYHRDRAAWHHYSHDLAQDTPCHVLGTLAVGWHTSLLPDLTMDEFDRPNMCDLWFARHCNERGIPRIVLAHRGDWIRNSEHYDKRKSIWGHYARHPEREAFHTQTLNSIEWAYGNEVAAQ
jgi:hypothetical protein